MAVYGTRQRRRTRKPGLLDLPLFMLPALLFLSFTVYTAWYERWDLRKAEPGRSDCSAGRALDRTTEVRPMSIMPEQSHSDDRINDTRPASCPDWCLEDHSTDDERDDLVLHMGADHTDGTVRKLLDPHLLDLRVARTDCPSEDRTGTPNLYVRAELELTTWEQAAELARTILDAFGYLQGADKD